MNRIFCFVFPVAMLAGSMISSAWGQETADFELSEEILKKVRLAQDALDEVQGTLETENLYVPAVEGINPAAVMAGGLNALEDLDGEGGVDPFTFVGLYEGNGLDGVGEFLERDRDTDRVLYKDRVVRLYSLKKLKEIYHQDLGTQPVAAPAPLKGETLNQMTLLKTALGDAQSAMEISKQYMPAVNGLNPYAVMVGGIDARGDLDRGPEVDPFTFIGLYAGEAVEGIKEKLGRDEQGRLTYDGRLIRLYPVSRLKRLEARRIAIHSSDE